MNNFRPIVMLDHDQWIDGIGLGHGRLLLRVFDVHAAVCYDRWAKDYSNELYVAFHSPTEGDTVRSLTSPTLAHSEFVWRGKDALPDESPFEKILQFSGVDFLEAVALAPLLDRRLSKWVEEVRRWDETFKSRLEFACLEFNMPVAGLDRARQPAAATAVGI